jgi:hypothetical protein
MKALSRFLRRKILLCLFCVLSLSLSSNHSTTIPGNLPVENRGIYAIWYNNNTVFSLPMIVGGQIVVQWGDIEKSKNVYDFSVVTSKILELRAMGKFTTLQINGNRKPDYLFDEVPWISEKLSILYL